MASIATENKAEIDKVKSRLDALEKANTCKTPAQPHIII